MDTMALQTNIEQAGNPPQELLQHIPVLLQPLIAKFGQPVRVAIMYEADSNTARVYAVWRLPNDPKLEGIGVMIAYQNGKWLAPTLIPIEKNLEQKLPGMRERMQKMEGQPQPQPGPASLIEERPGAVAAATPMARYARSRAAQA